MTTLMSKPHKARWAVIGATASILFATAPAASSNAQSDGRFSYGGKRCHEVVMALELDVDRVRPFVPDDYAVGTIGAGEPKVVASVAGLACDELEVEGKPAGRWQMAFLAVQVRPPDGSFFNNYQLWGPTSNPRIASRYAALGVGERGFLESLTIDTRLGDLESSSVMEVPWSYSPHRLEVDTSGPFAPPVAREFTIWTAGAKGNVTIKGQIENERFQFGTATLTVAPDSPLARILGTTSVTGGGFISTYEFTATAAPA